MASVLVGVRSRLQSLVSVLDVTEEELCLEVCSSDATKVLVKMPYPEVFIMYT